MDANELVAEGGGAGCPWNEWALNGIDPSWVLERESEVARSGGLKSNHGGGETTSERERA